MYTIVLFYFYTSCVYILDYCKLNLNQKLIILYLVLVNYLLFAMQQIKYKLLYLDLYLVIRFDVIFNVKKKNTIKILLNKINHFFVLLFID